MTLRWNQGGRKVSSITSQRSGKMTKSTLAVPGVSDGAVRTVKIDGSGWSRRVAPTGEKRRRSYLKGARFPCQATTSRGEWGSTARNIRPRVLR